MEKIQSLQNSKIKHLISLRKASKRKKENIIIIEGQKEIERALESKVEIISYYFCQDFIKDKELEKSLLKYKGTEVNSEVFQKISYKDKPGGLLLFAQRPQKKLEELQLSKEPFILILESVEKPGNLGAILRTADAVGVDAVILCEASTDIYHPNSIRSSLGAIFTVQTITCSNEEALEYLTKNKINTYVAELEASIDYKIPNYKKATAVVIGTEHEGLSDFWLKKATQNIKIPMNGKMDSLNASVSAAVISYEVLRQRE